MPRKVNKDMKCAFCTDSRDSPYVEIEVTLPEVDGPQRQFFGAHSACVTEAMAEDYAVEVDLLADPE